ncbi:toxin-antitoxin system YwqK family antitoxin [Fusobacterium ulcerans]|uniref:toxin-antitoxin system YwqK family antitoxin n=1 Tax=Fusobacterium ulcerans TaxID=861 RepID=UPI001D0A462D|nr:toxin-antitoxin system YwqK family antitoxin [Fusobacterium ulcerans]MCB8565957.1 toxin-antitoxin system YwqK family antitoxin [Fusobacterium ulcerans]MCB8647960.1 toxin-antitoxin system YwqK family antitoxin [Fusobacterium ulcerans]
MKKSKLLLIIMILCFSIFELSYSDAKRVEKIENKQIKNNIVYFKNESVPFTGEFRGPGINEEYKSGIKDGFFKGVILDGGKNFIYEGRYVEGIKHGQWVIKYPTGSNRAILRYNYDKPHGQWAYFYETNKIESYENFEDGILSGRVVSYDPKGNVKTQVTYRNGLLDGEAVFFHSPNVLDTTTVFSYGKLNGSIKMFSTDNIPLIEGTYKNNRRENIWKFFYKTGDIKTTVPYKNGLKDGKVIIYDKGGGVVLVSLFKNGNEVDDKGNIIEKSQPFKDAIVERFKKFNRNLKFEKYDKLLSEL